MRPTLLPFVVLLGGCGSADRFGADGSEPTRDDPLMSDLDLRLNATTPRGGPSRAEEEDAAAGLTILGCAEGGRPYGLLWELGRCLGLWGAGPIPSSKPGLKSRVRPPAEARR